MTFPFTHVVRTGCRAPGRTTAARPLAGILALSVIALAGCEARGGADPDEFLEQGPGSCSACIRFEPIVTLGESGGDEGAFSSRPHAIERIRQGYVVLASQEFPEPPFVFDSVGEFLGRIGTEGEGPDQYRMPSHVTVGPGDSLHIIDLMNARTSVLDPAQRLEVRTQPIVGFVWDALVLPSGRSIVNAEIRTLEGADLALHPLSPTGEVLRSFDEYERGDNELARFARQLHPAPDGATFWSVNHAHEYRINEWSAEGDPLRELRPSSPWFGPYDDVSYPTPETPPSPYAVGIWQDPSHEGLVWVIGEMADRDWARGLSGPIRVGGEEAYTRQVYDEVHDGWIEVIDAATGDIIASARTDLIFLSVVQPGVVAMAGEDAAGFSYAHLFRATLSR